MQELWNFLFSPLGVLVYIGYRLMKLAVWVFVLPRLLPYLPTAFAAKIARLRAAMLARLSRLATGLGHRWQECCP